MPTKTTNGITSVMLIISLNNSMIYINLLSLNIQNITFHILREIKIKTFNLTIDVFYF